MESLLARLHKIDPRLRTIVELKGFEGRTPDEIAALIGCAPRTVHKFWSFARHWLASELGAVDAPSGG